MAGERRSAIGNYGQGPDRVARSWYTVSAARLPAALAVVDEGWSAGAGCLGRAEPVRAEGWVLCLAPGHVRARTIPGGGAARRARAMNGMAAGESSAEARGAPLVGVMPGAVALGAEAATAAPIARADAARAHARPPAAMIVGMTSGMTSVAGTRRAAGQPAAEAASGATPTRTTPPKPPRPNGQAVAASAPRG
jgi:hypothetical protein